MISPVQTAMKNLLILLLVLVNMLSSAAGRYVPGSLDDSDVTPDTWRSLDLTLEKPDGSRASVQLLRPLWWLEQTGAREGGIVDLTMREMGLAGNATINKIRPCTADSRDAKPGTQIVIGKIRHENAIVWDLVFDNDAAHPLGVTANHPIYSADRDDWVPAGEIEIGEHVRTRFGTAKLTGKSQRPGRHEVYNIEVHRAHNYYVSQFGILAHNTGLDCGQGTPIVTKEVKVRPTPGGDGATSTHILERVDGEVNSVTHQVTKDGEVLHQHQTHVGKHGTERRFPDEWIEHPTVPAE